MRDWILVFFGGMLGALLRFAVQSFTSTNLMLWIVNVIGSLLLGSLNGYYEKNKKVASTKLFFTTGMLGAFTTFSSFSENWFYQLQESIVIGICYGIGMTLISCIAAWIGYSLFRGEKVWNG